MYTGPDESEASRFGEHQFGPQLIFSDFPFHDYLSQSTIIVDFVQQSWRDSAAGCQFLGSTIVGRRDRTLPAA